MIMEIKEVVGAGDSLQELRGFLELDPTNLRLISEVATASFDQGAADQARALLERYAKFAPLPPTLRNLKGLIARPAGRGANAMDECSAGLEHGNAAPAVRFNLAWALTMTGRPEQALEMMDEAASWVSGRAAALKVQLLHHADRLDEA